MKWSSVKDPEHVLSALREFDVLGQEAFLAKYGFAPSRGIYIEYGGRRYDIKAVAGAVYGYAFPDLGPLRHNQFGSGKSLIQLFKRLGFEVVDERQDEDVEESMEELSDCISSFLNGYIDGKLEPFGKDTLMYQSMESMVGLISSFVSKKYPSIKVRGSVGQGNWASVPWIALMDSGVTETTQTGVYVVYLFRSDMCGVYLTLNQGVTSLVKAVGRQNARMNLRARADNIWSACRDDLTERYSQGDEIDLGPSSTDLGQDYESSTIASKYYDADSVPQSDVLLNDLDVVLSTYIKYVNGCLLSATRSDDEMTRSGDVSLAVPALAPSAEARVLRLPESLREVGERALAYLHAGLHVVLAGAPGTGKTTLAQFIAYAWNRGAQVLPEQLLMAEAPLTTVGNSAWTPFHTIGGIVMTASGGFAPSHGIFMDPSVTGEVWRLRDEALVLDEMNRADLDRCIGDLYPLLSRSVEQVYPAGIPGVRVIRDAPRFRLIATINDATLDDIVFPISQGLARRFQRVELEGASLEDLLAFLSSGADPERLRVAKVVAQRFFERVSKLPRWGRKGSDKALRLPFGVGWFELLRRWVCGEFVLSKRDGEQEQKQEQELSAQAVRLLGDSLRGALRDEALERVLGELDEA